MSLRLGREEGIFTGISGGGSVASALKVAEKAAKGSHILTVVADTQERYISGPLYENLPAEMTVEEVKLSKSTPGFQLD